MIWWCWILLTCACLKSFLLLHQFWMRLLLSTEILVVDFSLLIFQSCRVSAERSTVKHMGFPLYVTCCFSVAALNSLSLCLVFASLINMCFGVFPRLKVGGEGDSGGWEGWMASLTQWTWVWVNTGSWWWTGRPGMLQSKLLDITDWQLNWHVSPWVYPVWDSLCLLDMIDCFLFHVGEIFN